MKKITGILFLFFGLMYTRHVGAQSPYQETYRPQVHFTPKAHWMNDPNGLVFYKGVYHMFFQYYAGSSVWGPNSWGHAVSTDLIHWKELEPALAPDSLGLIASGSAVVDAKNTSGFGRPGQTPIVAIYAYINQELEKKNINAQYQAIAYSLDETKTWTKYPGNPVVKNPGIRDFRDPKVIWYAEQNKWVMTVATQDHVTYYSSPNLKEWKKESEFGKTNGAHTGVWECPDLIYFEDHGKKIWVQIVSINPGGPNGGSATQYFVGDFNGSAFTPFDTATKWIDYGTDDYAGVTWSNTGNRRIFLGWMSNWDYATVVPTEIWRSSMTIPRELNIKKTGNSYLLSSTPVKELDLINEKPQILSHVSAGREVNLSAALAGKTSHYKLKILSDEIKDFSLVLSNNQGEELMIGFDPAANQFYVDRTRSGKIAFSEHFPKMIRAPRLSKEKNTDLVFVVDDTSVELFADDGQTVMTVIFFPNQRMENISLKSTQGFVANKIEFNPLRAIWNDELK